jgi:hypothetical protein
MTDQKAEEPKSELAGMTLRMQQAVEDQIAALTAGVTACLTEAQAGERKDAVQLVAATAGLLAAVAKVKGEFHQSYHITRAAEGGAANSAVSRNWPEIDGHTTDTYPYLGAKEVNALTIAQYTEYSNEIRHLRSSSDEEKKREAAEQAEMSAIKERERRKHRHLDPTPSWNGGSNEQA